MFFVFGATTDHRLNEFEILKEEHEEVMSALQKFSKLISKVLIKQNELTENTNSYK